MFAKDAPTTLSHRESLVPEMPLAWEPFSVMKRMHETMDAMFHDLFKGATPLDMPTLGRVPAVNVFVKNEDLIVECEVPGLKKEEIQISLTPDHLTITGEYKRKEEVKKEHLFRSEISYGNLYRVIRLPHEVKTDRVKAVVENGMLKITMPLLEPGLHKAISVKVD